MEKEYPSSDVAYIDTVTNVNHKPHPFTIGPRHVAHASDRCGGMLGEETLRAVPCVFPQCRTDYDGHTSDKVAFVKLKRDCTNEEITSFLQSEEVTKLTEAEKIDGFAFVETEEKFRVKENQDDND
jgi:hypothetical protein